MSEEQKSDTNTVVRWRTLDREGCQFGVRLSDGQERLEGDVEKVGKEVKDLKRTMDRTFWALVMAAIAFGSAALMLGLNLAVH